MPLWWEESHKENWKFFFSHLAHQTYVPNLTKRIERRTRPSKNRWRACRNLTKRIESYPRGWVIFPVNRISQRELKAILWSVSLRRRSRRISQRELKASNSSNSISTPGRNLTKRIERNRWRQNHIAQLQESHKENWKRSRWSRRWASWRVWISQRELKVKFIWIIARRRASRISQRELKGLHLSRRGKRRNGESHKENWKATG